MDAVITAAELIKQSEAFGLALRVVDGKLEVTGKPTAAASEFVKLLSLRKAEVIDELTPGKHKNLVFQDGPFVDDICAKELPPLPPEYWMIGIPDFATAWAIREENKPRFKCALGCDNDGSRFGESGYYVVAPVEFVDKLEPTPEPPTWFDGGEEIDHAPVLAF